MYFSLHIGSWIIYKIYNTSHSFSILLENRHESRLFTFTLIIHYLQSLFDSRLWLSRLNSNISRPFSLPYKQVLWVIEFSDNATILPGKCKRCIQVHVYYIMYIIPPCHNNDKGSSDIRLQSTLASSKSNPCICCSRSIPFLGHICHIYGWPLHRTLQGPSCSAYDHSHPLLFHICIASDQSFWVD